jgi:hypothetical protein
VNPIAILQKLINRQYVNCCDGFWFYSIFLFICRIRYPLCEFVNFVKELLISFVGNKFTKYGIENEVNKFNSLKQILISTTGNVPSSPTKNVMV